MVTLLVLDLKRQLLLFALRFFKGTLKKFKLLLEKGLLLVELRFRRKPSTLDLLLLLFLCGDLVAGFLELSGGVLA